MKRAKAKRGRPALTLPVMFDLENFEVLCRLQCTQEEMAAVLGWSLETLKARLNDDPKIKAAYERGRADGKVSLRRRQVQITRQEGGSGASMATWLGKQWLNQRDKVETTGPEGGPIQVVVSRQDTDY